MFRFHYLRDWRNPIRLSKISEVILRYSRTRHLPAVFLTYISYDFSFSFRIRQEPLRSSFSGISLPAMRSRSSLRQASVRLLVESPTRRRFAVKQLALYFSAEARARFGAYLDQPVLCFSLAATERGTSSALVDILYVSVFILDISCCFFFLFYALHPVSLCEFPKA